MIRDASRPEDERYRSYRNRGIALIFNHEHFHPFTKLGSRFGTEKDGEDLKNILLELQFDVHLYKDITYRKIKQIIDEGEYMFSKMSENMLTLFEDIELQGVYFIILNLFSAYII